MAGIYLHIPFCKKACNYCNFHFSTNLKTKSELVRAIQKELVFNVAYLQDHTIETIYFGGGTPSVLSADELDELISTIKTHYNAREVKEITIEANPDDLTLDYLKSIYNTPINRLSIGVQSFKEKDLRWMNRAHNARQAHESIENALKTGFKHLSVDLIYGLPESTTLDWLKNLETLAQFDVEHASCYALTVEGNTALHYAIENKKLPPVKDETMVRDFNLLMQFMPEHGFEQYEISNFARDAAFAQHNSNYWLGAWYLGVGPSAHSFNGSSRQWNGANNASYIKSLNDDILPFLKEELTLANKYNEYVMTRLRTSWGCSEKEILKRFGNETSVHFNQNIAQYLINGWVEIIKNKAEEVEINFNSFQTIPSDTIYKLSNKGKLHADLIASELFI